MTYMCVCVGRMNFIFLPSLSRMTTAINTVAAVPINTAHVPMGTYQDWLVAWKEWARTRKRGKMAQFIVDKLEDSVSCSLHLYTCLSKLHLVIRI